MQIFSRAASLLKWRSPARREAERGELNERIAELELASKQKSDLLISISHELRIPLNAIIGFSEIMLDHDIRDDQRQMYLAQIQRGGHHLLGLVNDILDLAKVESGHMELSLEPVALRELMVGCVEVMLGVAEPKQLTIGTCCEPADALVTADPVRLKQILYNLLSNAVKFTPAGGQISVSARVNSTEAVIAVRDSGIGIRSEDRGVIFEPFRQVNIDQSSRREGTGLGLPLVRELVELHGGRVWLTSAPGAGSCFTFTLPHALEPGETAELEALALAS
jgi:signal transduction histidine kinase